MPGEEVATEVVSKSFDTMGPAAGMFLLLLAIVVGMFYLASIWIKNHKKNGARKDTPKPVAEAQAPTKTWFEGMTASMVKAEKEKTDESQDEAIKDLGTNLKDEFQRLDGRIDELFRVEGEHRKETKAEIKEVLDKLEAHRDKSNEKNERQDHLINDLRERAATLTGMLKAKARAGSTGVTQFLPQDDD
jgi:ElaB/YqjD/DUF883 family membrane-anchored ribosome-binding protein